MAANVHVENQACNEMKGCKQRNQRYMIPTVKRTCLSATSVALGSPNVEEVPLDAKLPMIPGNSFVLYTSRLGEKLYRPSPEFHNCYRTDAYFNNEYHCLHDKHLLRYFLKRKHTIKTLISKGFLTSDHQVVCSLKQYNLYRQYLKQLYIDALNNQYFDNLYKERAERRDSIRIAAEEKASNSKNETSKSNAQKSRIMKNQDSLDIAERAKKENQKKRDEAMNKRIEKEIHRDDNNAHIRDILLISQKKESLLREELHVYQYQEEIYRRKAIEERKKIAVEEKQQLLKEKYNLKRQFHVEKLLEADTKRRNEEHNRQNNVKSWESYYIEKQTQQSENLIKMIEKENKEREINDCKIKESLAARGWSGGVLLSRRHDLQGFTEKRPAKSHRVSKNSRNNSATKPRRHTWKK